MTLLTLIAAGTLSSILSWESGPRPPNPVTVMYHDGPTHVATLTVKNVITMPSVYGVDVGETLKVENTADFLDGSITIYSTVTPNNASNPGDYLDVLELPEGYIAIPASVVIPEHGSAEIKIMKLANMGMS